MQTSIVSPEVFALVKKLEAVVVAIKFTVDGEVYVCKKGDVVFELPLEIEALGPLPELFEKDRYKRAMCTVHSFVEKIRGMGREVPPLRYELVNLGIPKKDLLKLEEWGLLKLTIIPLKSAESGRAEKPVRSMYFTNQGRAAVRQLVDENYGRGGDAHWNSVREEAAAVRRRRSAEESRGSNDGVSQGGGGSVQP